MYKNVENNLRVFLLNRDYATIRDKRNLRFCLNIQYTTAYLLKFVTSSQ